MYWCVPGTAWKEQMLSGLEWCAFFGLHTVHLQQSSVAVISHCSLFKQSSNTEQSKALLIWPY